MEPLHYLPLIERKLNALDQAAPLADWDLPVAFGILRRLMEARHGNPGKREYVQVLQLMGCFTQDDLHHAVKRALELNAISFDAINSLSIVGSRSGPPNLTLQPFPICRAPPLE